MDSSGLRRLFSGKLFGFQMTSEIIFDNWKLNIWQKRFRHRRHHHRFRCNRAISRSRGAHPEGVWRQNK